MFCVSPFRTALCAFALLSLVLCWQSAAVAHAPAARAPRVLVVQSYNPEYVWTQNINKGIREALRGLSPVIEVVYLDAKRKPDAEGLHERSAEIWRHIQATAPQVVITVDDAAQQYLVAPYLKGHGSPQVIFCGVNAPLSMYGFPAANVSGVRERWHFREAFALLKKIQPSLRSVAVLSDNSESTGFVFDDMRAQQKQGGPFAVKLAGVERIKTFQAWKNRILYYQSRADALALGIYHTLVDETTGLVVPPEQVMAWTNSVNKKPTLGFSDYAIEHGQMAGILESGEEQGFLAGNMALKVLQGKVAAGSLPVRINQRGIVLVNLKTAQRLGIVIPYTIISAAGVVLQ